MNEICKCNGEKCEVKEKCYRYTSKAKDKYQDWADFYKQPKDKDGKCGMFLENKKWNF